MAQRVVDPFEVVEIEPEQRAHRVGRLRLAHHLLEMLLHGHPVGQACQAVIVRHVRHAVFDLLRLRDVGGDAAEAAKFMSLEDRLAGQRNPALLAGLVLNLQHEIPEPLMTAQRRFKNLAPLARLEQRSQECARLHETGRVGIGVEHQRDIFEKAVRVRLPEPVRCALLEVTQQKADQLGLLLHRGFAEVLLHELQVRPAHRKDQNAKVDHRENRNQLVRST